MSEKQCLEYCYKKGYEWRENGVKLYDVLDRVSCWCCSNKNMKELRNYKKYLPEYFMDFIGMARLILHNAEYNNNTELANVTNKFLLRLEQIREEG